MCLYVHTDTHIWIYIYMYTQQSNIIPMNAILHVLKMDTSNVVHVATLNTAWWCSVFIALIVS